MKLYPCNFIYTIGLDSLSIEYCRDRLYKKVTMAKFMLDNPLKLTMTILCHACYRIKYFKEEETTQPHFTHAATQAVSNPTFPQR